MERFLNHLIWSDCSCVLSRERWLLRTCPSWRARVIQAALTKSSRTSRPTSPRSDWKQTKSSSARQASLSLASQPNRSESYFATNNIINGCWYWYWYKIHNINFNLRLTSWHAKTCINTNPVKTNQIYLEQSPSSVLSRIQSASAETFVYIPGRLTLAHLVSQIE